MVYSLALHLAGWKLDFRPGNTNLNTKTIMKSKARALPKIETQEFLKTLEIRFTKNMGRHKGLDWLTVKSRLEAQPEKLWSLNEMERSGGEPDIVSFDKNTGSLTFMDCTAESPKGRRSVCYDPQALQERKENKPAHSAIGMAEEMGIELLTEDQYRNLQKLGSFDKVTSSWLITPEPIRKLGGAIFGDFRYDTVFVYHNGAQSYYAARGFRGSLKI